MLIVLKTTLTNVTWMHVKNVKKYYNVYILHAKRKIDIVNSSMWGCNCKHYFQLELFFTRASLQCKVNVAKIADFQVKILVTNFIKKI